MDRPGVVGYVPGVWDMFHVGHLNILTRARPHCDRLVVGAVTDEVVVDVSSDKTVMWDRLGFDVIFKGDDWRGTPKGDRLERDMAARGVRVVYFPYTPHTSSSMLRALIATRSGTAS